ARAEEAMPATRAAAEEAIVPGGGVALVRCIPALDKLTFDDERRYGVNIVRRALEEPLRQIARNARVARSRSRCARSLAARASTARSSLRRSRRARPRLATTPRRCSTRTSSRP